jgi:hypothetical protein
MKVQNSAWKIDPLEEGAKFYVENRPSGGRCKILRGKSTFWKKVQNSTWKIDPLEHAFITLYQ